MKVARGMARPSLFTHRKFIRLSRILGASYKAVGVLESIWHHAYQDGDPTLGTAEDVEFMIQWDGESGACAAALVETEFLEACDGECLLVHDLADHAPDYVLGRYQKEAQRRGVNLSRDDVREILRGNLFLVQSEDGRWTVQGQSPDCQPTPAPAPAPNKEKTTSSSSSRTDDDAFVKKVILFWEENDLRPQVRTVSKARRSAILARRREHTEDAVWTALKNRAASNFLNNIYNEGSGAPIDFVFGPKNFPKVADGNYNDRKKKGGPGGIYDSTL